MHAESLPWGWGKLSYLLWQSEKVWWEYLHKRQGHDTGNYIMNSCNYTSNDIIQLKLIEFEYINYIILYLNIVLFLGGKIYHS